MDNVTHTLFALTLARTPLGRERGSTAALVLASNAPDSDFLVSMTGASYLDGHRGPPHGPWGVVGLGIFVAALVCVADGLWLFDRRWKNRDSLLRFVPLLVTSMIGVAAHILMDLPTSYGTRL